MSLRAHAVDGDACCDPLLDVTDEAGGFGVGGAVKIVVVDVEFGVGVGGAGCFEGNLDVVFAEKVVEDIRC